MGFPGISSLPSVGGEGLDSTAGLNMARSGYNAAVNGVGAFRNPGQIMDANRPGAGPVSSDDERNRNAMAEMNAQALGMLRDQKPVAYQAYGGPAKQMQSMQANPELQAQRMKMFQNQNEALGRQQTSANQQADDAIQRRFSSMGMNNSGAMLASQLDSQRQLGNQAMDQQNALRDQQLGFQQNAEQSQLGRDQAAENYNTQLANQLGMANTDLGNKAQDMNAQMNLARAQALLDAGTSQFNKELATKEFNKPGPGMFGQGGFLGLGLSNMGDPGRIF